MSLFDPDPFEVEPLREPDPYTVACPDCGAAAGTYCKRPSGHRACKSDSSGADWFMCPLGTVGCPISHGGRTPHCIACASGTPCLYRHDPPVLEQDYEDHRTMAQVQKDGPA